MNIFAMDSSFKFISVALVKDDKLCAEYAIDAERTQSENLMKMTASILDFCGLEMKDMDFLVASDGPGSFTGLRISSAALRAISYVNNTPILTVSSLKAMAYRYRHAKYVASFIDARRERAYCSIYSFKSDELITVKKEALRTIEEFREDILSLGDEVLLVGDAYERYPNFFSSENIRYAALKKAEPIAAPMALYALEHYREMKVSDAFNLAINYMKEAQAVEDRKKDNDKKF